MNPKRVVKTYRMKLNHTVEHVFPLLCPQREHDWIEPWSADIIFSSTGIAESDCVFTTTKDGNDTIWVITHYQPPQRIAMVSVDPQSHTRHLVITLEPTETGCIAHWHHTFTAIMPKGLDYLIHDLLDDYNQYMPFLEKALTHYLHTGTCLSATE